MKKLDKNFLQNMQKVLIVTFDGIGDMVVTTPFFREIKKLFPQIQIDVLAHNRNYKIIENNLYISNIYFYDSRKSWGFETLKILKNRKYDLLINLWRRQSLHVLFRTFFIGAKINIGLEKVGNKKLLNFIENSSKLYYFTLPQNLENNQDIHLTDRFFKLFELFDIDSSQLNKNYELFLSESYKLKAEKEISEIKNNFKLIGINYHGTSKRNTLSKDKVTEILKEALSSVLDAIFIIFWTPPIFDEVSEIKENLNSERVILSPKTADILEASTLMEHLDLLITTGTASMNIGSALNKKMVIIHSKNTGFEEFYPRMESKYQVVFSEDRRVFNGNFSTKDVIKNIIELIKDDK